MQLPPRGEVEEVGATVEDAVEVTSEDGGEGV